MAAAPLDFHLLFESLPTPHLVVLPASLTVAAANPAAVQLFGQDPTGQPVAALFDAAAPEASPATWAQLQAATAPLVLPPHPRPAATAAAARFWQTTLTPVRLTPAEPARYLLCQLLDVTETLPTHEESQLGRQSYDLLARTTHDCVWDADLPTGQVWRNEQFWEITGYTAGPETNTIDFWRSCLHPDDATQVQQTVEKVLAGTEAFLTAEYRFRHRQGHWLEVLDRAYIVRDAAARPVRLLGAMRDVTERRRAQRELQQTAEQFQFLADHLPQLIWMADADGRLDYANEGWRRYTGLSLAETQAQGFLAAVHPDDQAATLAHWKHCVATGESPDITFRLRAAATGRYRHHLMRAYAQRNPAGQVQRWFGSITDVHEQRLADRRGRRQLVRQLQQFDQLPVHLIMLRGPEHVIEYFSAQARPYLTADSLGRPAAAAHPSPGAGLLAQLDVVYRTGQLQQLKAVPIQPLDAPPEAPTRYLDCTLHALRAADGTTDGVLLLGLDTTEQVQQQHATQSAVAASQRQQEQFRFLADFIPQMVWITDAAGRSEYMSERWTQYTGVDQETLRDFSKWSTLLPADQRETLQQRWQHALATGTFYEIEIQLRGRDGAYRWFLAQAQPMRDAAGNVVRWFGTTTDIDDQKRAQHLLEQTDRLLNRILGRVPALIATFTGPDHLFTFINDTFAQVLGSRAQVGRSLSQALPEMAEQGFVALMDHVYQTGEAYTGHEHVVMLADSAEPRYFDFVLQRLHDGPGPDRSLLVFAIDTTEQVRSRKRANALAAEVHGRDEQLRIMAESLPQITYSSHPDGTTRYLSPQWFSYTGQAADGADTLTAWTSAVHPDDLAAAYASFAEAQASQSVWEQELRLRRHDGQYRWHLSRALPMLDARGAISCWYGSSTDIHEHRELAEQLRHSQQRYELAALATDDAIWDWNQTTGSLIWNDAMQRVFGYAPEQVGTTIQWWYDQIHPEDTERVVHGIHAAIDGGQASWQDEYRYRRADGTYAHVLDRGYIGRDAQGRAQRMIGAIQDITAQQEAKLALRQSENRFRSLAESVPQLVWTIEADGQTSYVNQRWTDFTGQNLAQTQNLGWAELVHPDMVASTFTEFRNKLLEGKPFNFENQLRRASDGAYRWLLHRAEPLHDEHGRFVRWVGTSTDVHDQHLLADELRRREEEFRFLAESVPQIVWTADGQGRNEYVNQRWLDYTGLPLTESLGEINWAHALHPDDLELMTERWVHSVQTGEFFEVEYRLRARDGAYRWFLGQARALRHSTTQEVVRWFGTCTDIHDVKLTQQLLREQNDELVRINQDLDNFVYTASHDLKQPIHNMAGIFEELTRTAYFRDPDAIKLISMFEKSLHQINDTIHSLSELVRVQKLRHEWPAEPIDVAQLTEEVLLSIGELLTTGRAVVHTNFAAVPVLQFVRPHLQSILYNLISNALKYASPHRRPRIELTTYLTAEGQPVLEVQDNGLGIDLERFGGELFQLFRRFHDHVDGSGLGLYLVNRVVQGYGGRITVASTVGKGTTFRVLFPPWSLV
ncbi:PAS domain-containing protein [Hymenobacter weizhouensis]|uniref:PAS domain-containing protein n=1 Tax=Hymenobacter sp. YIM 151500-1 TaxID=2987689 RepID=UPI00222799A0|nr:PAS domain-containing protein [Hymenobacter sp. YIM 151500-1]UYZ62694.1 PAS domain-containing protein [Hymenobacter sp. YIM 151500-1]